MNSLSPPRRSYPRTIHRAAAHQLLCDGTPHRLRLWKRSTGEILLYPRAVFKSERISPRRIRVLLLPAGVIREFAEIALFEIDDMTIYF